MKKVSKNIKENKQVAELFLGHIFKKRTQKTGATVVALSGELGAGKTSFTQAVARILGVKSKISSPTFVLIKKYPIAEQARYGTGPIKNHQYKFLYHLDAYRLKNEKELLHLGWEEIVGNKDHLVFIEWPEMVSKIIPKKASRINIAHTKEGYREFVLK